MEAAQSDSGLSLQLGKRLRQIRKKARLSLRAVARRIGRESKSYFTLLYRLEKGKIARPSINLIADYLRACGATFSDISDILNQTQKPAPPPNQKIHLATENLPEPLKTEARQLDERLSKTRPEQSLENRLNRIRRMLKNRILRTLLEDTLYNVITAPEAGDIEYEKLAELCRYGRKLFSIHLCNRTRPERRKQLLDRERNRTRAHNLPEAGLNAIDEAIETLYQEMEKQQLLTLDLNNLTIPANLQNIPLHAPIRAEKKLLLEKQRMRLERESIRANVGIAIFLEMNRELRLENLDYKPRAWAIDFINRLFLTALNFEDQPEEQRRQLNQLVESSAHPELALRLLSRFKKIYPKYRHLTTPKPE
ncbi:MAG: helix-turn-helix domain-containing protein [bacterium]